jgi:hypothetical protein
MLQTKIGTRLENRIAGYKRLGAFICVSPESIKCFSKSKFFNLTTNERHYGRILNSGIGIGGITIIISQVA